MRQGKAQGSEYEEQESSEAIRRADITADAGSQR